MAKSKVSRENVCGDCKHCTPYLAFHTLNVKGQPTMGTCPYWTQSKCVLLSQPACKKYEKRILSGFDSVSDSEPISHKETARKPVRAQN